MTFQAPPSRRFLSLFGALLAAAFGAASRCEAAPQAVAIPAYFYPVYPDPLWAQMEAGVPAVAFAVMNPASGAGFIPDSNYVSQIAATRAAGVKILGYVTSSYATADPAAIKADIDKYFAWYHVDGIFVDEAENHCENAPYYADLHAYTKARSINALTVINPGTVTPECYAATADILLNFEGSHSQYLAWEPLGWEAGYDPSRFWHLVYNTAEADMPSTVLLSQARGAGYVYVTPDQLIPNPWDTLPVEPYWSTELAYVQPTASACDAAVLKPKIKLTGLDTGASDDSLRFSGRFTLPGTPLLDPVADGFRFVISDTTGAAVDLTLEGGAYAAETGWRAGKGNWTYRDDTDAPAFGIRRASVKAKSDGVSTVVTFSVLGAGGSFPVNSSKLPLTAAVLLSPDEPTSLCATAKFPGPKPSCEVTGFGKGVRCQ